MKTQNIKSKEHDVNKLGKHTHSVIISSEVALFV